MIEFFQSTTFQTVLSALNSGFLKTLELFFITLIGALPLGLIIAFGSMNRWAPLKWPVLWVQQGKRRRWERKHPDGPAYAPKVLDPGAKRVRRFFHALAKRWTKFCFTFRPISLICRLVVWIIRGTPLVLQIIALFYVPGMQKLFNWPSGESGRMIAVCVAFIINYACYFSEIYRGGIQGVPVGQQEAGQVLGMTKWQIFRHVTLLQMVKRIVPPMSNEVITLVKDTSLARVIALQEIIWMGESFMKGNSGISGLVWPLFFTAVYYLIFSGIVTLLLGKLEKKLELYR